MNERFKEWATSILMDSGIVPCKLDDTLSGLLAYYNNGRYYHNPAHILYMLDRMEEAGWTSTNLSFAILFHDVYYALGVGRGVNERISADIALRSLEDCLYIFRDCAAIERMIMATADFMDSIHTDTNCQKICDLDLSSLAREPYEDFVYQQREILMENGLGVEHLHKSAYFLNTLLEKRGDDLFYTDYGKKHWLDKAKDNIQRLESDYGS